MQKNIDFFIIIVYNTNIIIITIKKWKEEMKMYQLLATMNMNTDIRRTMVININDDRIFVCSNL